MNTLDTLKSLKEKLSPLLDGKHSTLQLSLHARPISDKPLLSITFRNELLTTDEFLEMKEEVINAFKHNATEYLYGFTFQNAIIHLGDKKSTQERLDIHRRTRNEDGLLSTNNRLTIDDYNETVICKYVITINSDKL